jgi:hypothetical protein
MLRSHVLSADLPGTASTAPPAHTPAPVGPRPAPQLSQAPATGRRRARSWHLGHLDRRLHEQPFVQHPQP